MQTVTSNLAEPIRGKTTHIRRWFRDLLEHFPTSNVKIGGTVCKLYQIYHFWKFVVVKSLMHAQDNWFFYFNGIVCWNVLNTMQPDGAKLVKKLRRYYRKTERKWEKIEFLPKIRLCLRGCKASFYRKTTWQAFILHPKMSFQPRADPEPS